MMGFSRPQIMKKKKFVTTYSVILLMSRIYYEPNLKLCLGNHKIFQDFLLRISLQTVQISNKFQEFFTKLILIFLKFRSLSGVIIYKFLQKSQIFLFLWTMSVMINQILKKFQNLSKKYKPNLNSFLRPFSIKSCEWSKSQKFRKFLFEIGPQVAR